MFPTFANQISKLRSRYFFKFDQKAMSKVEIENISNINTTNDSGIQSINNSNLTNLSISNNRSASSASIVLDDEFQRVIDAIKKNINQNEKEIRICLIDAHNLKEERFPNANVLIQG